MIRNHAISTLKPCQNRKVAAIRDACDRRGLRVILHLWGCYASVFSQALCPAIEGFDAQNSLEYASNQDKVSGSRI